MPLIRMVHLTQRDMRVYLTGGRTANGQGPDEDGADDDDHEDYCSLDVDGLSAVPHEDQYSDSDGNEYEADGDDEGRGRTDKRSVK